MAEVYISEFQDQFRCSICLNLLKDPVTIPCGHSFCMSCITDCWNQDAENRVYFCPQCRQTFTPRPILVKNIMLIQVVEKLKKTHFQTDGSGPSYAGPEDVECDVCAGRKRKPVKSCLVCLESYCQTHFERHEEFYSGKRHKVTEATGRLQEMICSQHGRLLEVFCCTDQTFICLWCTMDEHKNHDTVSAAVEKQRLLEDNHRKFQQRIEQKEKKLHELRETIKTHKIAAQSAVEDTERIFTELIRSIERRRSEVIQLIRDQEKTAVSRAEGVLKELEQEIDDLRRKQEEIQQLHTDYHISFIQNFESLSGSSGSTDVITVSPLPSFDDVKKSVIQLKEKVDDLCAREIGKRSGEVSSIENIPTTESMTRRELLQYFHLFSLDPNTVNNHVCLSEEDRTASGTKPVQQYPDHPDRFDFFRQVLCRESVSGRCYWEVEWSGSVRISMSYKTIKRKGKTFDCMFGRNDESWCLLCSSTKFSFWHDYKPTKLPVVSGSSRIGVFVDHSAGILSFYSVSDTMTLIHRVHTTFTQPLYPGFLIRQVSAVTLLTVGNV